MKEPYKILVVDDNETISRLLSEMLRDEGYSVSVATRGDEVLKKLQKQPCHLVLLDLVLPGMHGSQVFRKIKNKFPGTDVVIMTGRASFETAVEALRLGAQDYLTKPFESLDIVSQVIKRAFEKRRILEENERLCGELKSKSEELEGVVKRLSLINEMGKALHSIFDIKDLLNFFVQVVADELEAEKVSVMLLNRESDELMIEASIGVDENLLRTVRCSKEEGITGWVMQ